MNHVRMQSKFLAALLAILMVLSVVVALPAAAEETAAPVSAEKVLYSLDMSKAGALDATATAEWLAKNNGFATTATNTNTIDADGFYKIAKSNVVMSNGAPNDFFNLLAGWYPGYETPGKTYEISMDLRLDKESTYLRETKATYVDGNGNTYNKLYTEESGHSFFAARISGNYESLFRIGTVDGKTYLFAESNTDTVTPDNYKTLGNVFVKDAKGNKIYVANDSGSVSEGASFGLACIIDPERSYEVKAGNVYALRIVYELTKYTDGTNTTIKAHLYVKGENDAEETYLGFSTWISRAGSAANGFRLSDAAGVVSFANVKVTVDEPATVVWSADLSKFGPSANGEATNTNLTNGYVANVFALAGSSLASSTIGSAKLVGGFLHGGGNGSSIVANGTYSPFADLLTGNFTYKGQKLDTTFIEFDYKLGTDFSAPARSDAATVGGTSYTIVNDHAVKDGGSFNLRFRSGKESSAQLFRISANGYLYTTDLESTVKTTATGVDGYLYYMNGETKVFFDANGYRYTLNGNEKSYIDDTSKAAPAVSGLEIGGSLNPAKLNQAYKLTKGTTYRIGVKNVVESVSAGISTIKQTVYIKAPGDTEWTLVGTSTQKWYDSTASGYDANYQIIWAAGVNGMMFGGNMVAYACVDGQHVDGYDVTTETVLLSDTGIAYDAITCELCGHTAMKDGVLYTSKVLSSTCETSYTLWTATNGSGKTFITDVTEGSHNYATASGLCSKCNTYAYMPNVAKRGGTSLAIAKGLDNAPAYDSTTQTIKAPNGGMALCYPANKLNPRSPFIMTLEFKLTEAILNSESANSAWPLFSYQSGNGSNSVLSEFVGVHLIDNNPTLTLGVYTDRPIKTLAYDEWHTLQIAVVPDSDETLKYNAKNELLNSTADARIYLDGEMLGEKYDFPLCPGALTGGNVRVGIQTAGSKYRFAWEARYVDFQQTDLAGVYTQQNSNEVINIRYDRFQTGCPSHDSARANIGTTLSTFRPTAVVGGKYGILGNTNDKNVSLSTLLADGTEFGLSGKKYEIKLKFAVPNTDDDGDGKPDAISGSMNLVRLSKYNEAIQSILLAYRSTDYSTVGQIYAKTHDLYDQTGAPITILREFDENGVPTELLDLRVVVDEANNTYSIYVGDDIAYYSDGGELVPFMNMTMPLNKDGGTGKTTYGSITKDDAVAAGYSGTYQYMRVFRSINNVALEELSVKLIPDSNVELVGTQVKTADKTTSGGFDLRFVFGLDDLYKENVQFDVKAYKNGQYVGSQSSEPVTTVFSSIIAGDSKLYAYECTEGDYLTAVKVVGIEETTAFDIYTFEITAYLVDVNGNRISPRTYIVSCNGLGGNIRTVGK